MTATILDDDEPPVPSVTLLVDNFAIPEAAGAAAFSVTLSEVTTVPVIVDLALSGTAEATSDYVAAGTRITVPPGSVAVKSVRHLSPATTGL